MENAFILLKQMANGFLLYLKSDICQISLSLVMLAVNGLIAWGFKTDRFKIIQAYRAFDLSDKSLSYIHQESTVSGNLNIIITTILTVSYFKYIHYT